MIYLCTYMLADIRIHMQHGTGHAMLNGTKAEAITRTTNILVVVMSSFKNSQQRPVPMTVSRMVVAYHIDDGFVLVGVDWSG